MSSRTEPEVRCDWIPIGFVLVLGKLFLWRSFQHLLSACFLSAMAVLEDNTPPGKKPLKDWLGLVNQLLWVGRESEWLC